MGDQWQQPPIGDYGFLSDCTSAALVSRAGCVDWWCVPRFDSPSVFGRLLDPEGGHWTIQPAADFDVTREYLTDSLVLRTLFTTSSGVVALTDTLLFEAGARGHDIGRRSPHVLVRRVQAISGAVAMTTEFAPRMEYGRTQPHLSVTRSGVRARGGPVELTCDGPVNWELHPDRAVAGFTSTADEQVEFRLTYAPSFRSPAASSEAKRAGSVEDTTAAWQSWAAAHGNYDGAYPDLVRRSSVILQGLTYQPSGAVIAAATTSLPELPGGDLNFDYRFAWLRDLSLTVRSLWLAACPDEPNRLLQWFADAAGHVGDELVQIMYGVEGERDLTERTLDNLAGYRDSRPVRVGNEAWKQQQLDVLGEVIDAAHQLRSSLDSTSGPVRQLLVAFADRAAAGWSEPDSGMWEARDQRRHYTSSKVMCWVALDRAVSLAEQIGAPAEAAERWAAARDDVRDAIRQRAWSESAGAYAGAFDSHELDASVLVLPLVGFLPATDERMRATIEAVAAGLDSGGLIRRWRDDPNGFLLCTYWLSECLAMAGESARADAAFRRATGYANDLGLLAEQADPNEGVMWGNLPQAFSHVGLINAAWRLAHPQTTDPAS